MGSRIFHITTCLILISGLFAGCKKDLIISEIPSISLNRFYTLKYANSSLDSVVMVDVDFQDGDGDFGLSLSDTMPPFRIGDPYFYNVFVEYLNGKNGVYTYQISGSNDTLNFNDRIADLKPESRVKAILGTLHIKITPTISTVIPDSIKLNVFIVDRKLHKSNILNIGPIPVAF
jgi:hypothetical protein